jgi:hypothetical protein
MTIIDSGSFSRDRAPVEEMMVFSSTVTPGKGVT